MGGMKRKDVERQQVDIQEYNFQPITKTVEQVWKSAHELQTWINESPKRAALNNISMEIASELKIRAQQGDDSHLKNPKYSQISTKELQQIDYIGNAKSPWQNSSTTVNTSSVDNLVSQGAVETNSTDPSILLFQSFQEVSELTFSEILSLASKEYSHSSEREIKLYLANLRLGREIELRRIKPKVFNSDLPQFRSDFLDTSLSMLESAYSHLINIDGVSLYRRDIDLTSISTLSEEVVTNPQKTVSVIGKSESTGGSLSDTIDPNLLDNDILVANGLVGEKNPDLPHYEFNQNIDVIEISGLNWPLQFNSFSSRIFGNELIPIPIARRIKDWVSIFFRLDLEKNNVDESIDSPNNHSMSLLTEGDKIVPPPEVMTTENKKPVSIDVERTLNDLTQLEYTAPEWGSISADRLLIAGRLWFGEHGQDSERLQELEKVSQKSIFQSISARSDANDIAEVQSWGTKVASRDVALNSSVPSLIDSADINDVSEWMSVDEAAEYLNVARRTVWRDIKEAAIPTKKVIKLVSKEAEVTEVFMPELIDQRKTVNKGRPKTTVPISH